MNLNLNWAAHSGKAFLMSEESSKNMSREDRLAAKLRENLRRRKAQSRSQQAESGENGVSKPDLES